MAKWREPNGHTYKEAERGRFDALLLRYVSDEVDYYWTCVAYTDGEYVVIDKTGFNEAIDLDVVKNWADEFGFEFEYEAK